MGIPATAKWRDCWLRCCATYPLVRFLVCVCMWMCLYVSECKRIRLFGDIYIYIYMHTHTWHMSPEGKQKFVVLVHWSPALRLARLSSLYSLNTLHTQWMSHTQWMPHTHWMSQGCQWWVLTNKYARAHTHKHVHTHMHVHTRMFHRASQSCWEYALVGCRISHILRKRFSPHGDGTHTHIAESKRKVLRVRTGRITYRERESFHTWWWHAYTHCREQAKVVESTHWSHNLQRERESFHTCWWHAYTHCREQAKVRELLHGLPAPTCRRVLVLASLFHGGAQGVVIRACRAAAAIGMYVYIYIYIRVFLCLYMYVYIYNIYIYIYIYMVLGIWFLYPACVLCEYAFIAFYQPRNSA
jgi:hypothetical protein